MKPKTCIAFSADITTNTYAACTLSHRLDLAANYEIYQKTFMVSQQAENHFSSGCDARTAPCDCLWLPATLQIAF